MRYNQDLRGEPRLSGVELIRRHDALKEEADDWESECEEWATEPAETRGEKPEDPLTEDERTELADLAGIQNEISRDSELIREDCFQDYAQELAQDIGRTTGDVDEEWPLTCIDWERAASELAHDYSTIEFAGESYYVRD